MTTQEEFIHENLDRTLFYLGFLISPRILKLKTHQNERKKFVFKLLLTEIDFDNNIEFFSFEWCDMTSICEIGSIDLLKIKNCSKRDETSFIIITDGTNKSNTSITDEGVYEISCENFNDNELYVSGLNYMSKIIQKKKDFASNK